MSECILHLALPSKVTLFTEATDFSRNDWCLLRQLSALQTRVRQCGSCSKAVELVRIGWAYRLRIADCRSWGCQAEVNVRSRFRIELVVMLPSFILLCPQQPYRVRNHEASSSAEALVEGLGMRFERLSHLPVPPGSIRILSGIPIAVCM